MGQGFRLREDWLRRVGEAMAPHIEKAAGAPLPNWRVACGFPSSGGRKGGKRWTRGECWSADASADKHAEIFINPGVADAETVAAILAHELIHAALPEAAHGPKFQAAARRIGHAKPFTSANPTPDFWAWAAPILAEAGEYPHAELRTDQSIAAPKKQAARMLKVECDECGYVARVARKWLEEVGAPHCPAHGPMICEDADGGDPIELAA